MESVLARYSRGILIVACFLVCALFSFFLSAFVSDAAQLSNVNVEPLEDLVLPDAIIDYRKFRGLFFTVAHVCRLPLDRDLTYGGDCDGIGRTDDLRDRGNLL